MLSLFKVTCWFDGEEKVDTFDNFVIAGNAIEAERIVKEEIWDLSEMEIKSLEKIDMSLPTLLCSEI